MARSSTSRRKGDQARAGREAPATSTHEPVPSSTPMDLDRRIHEPGRLGILSALAGAGEELTFSELGRLLSLSDGNLIMHLRTLEEAGWVQAHKTKKESGRQRTLYAMTAAGQAAFADYLDQLEGIIDQARR